MEFGNFPDKYNPITQAQYIEILDNPPQFSFEIENRIPGILIAIRKS